MALGYNTLRPLVAFKDKITNFALHKTEGENENPIRGSFDRVVATAAGINLHEFGNFEPAFNLNYDDSCEPSSSPYPYSLSANAGAVLIP